MSETQVLIFRGVDVGTLQYFPSLIIGCWSVRSEGREAGPALQLVKKGTGNKPTPFYLSKRIHDFSSRLRRAFLA